MTTPSEKLAQSLELLRKLQAGSGAAAICARDLTRTHRERLLVNGFLQEVMKGWYVRSRPNEGKGESTAWYASFWRFCAVYLDARFARHCSLSPEQSLTLHAGNWRVPRQPVLSGVITRLRPLEEVETQVRPGNKGAGAVNLRRRRKASANLKTAAVTQQLPRSS